MEYRTVRAQHTAGTAGTACVAICGSSQQLVLPQSKSLAAEAIPVLPTSYPLPVSVSLSLYHRQTPQRAPPAQGKSQLVRPALVVNLLQLVGRDVFSWQIGVLWLFEVHIKALLEILRGNSSQLFWTHALKIGNVL